MLFIIEIVMLIAGIWAIATGKMPGVLFGGGQYKIEGSAVRLLGLLLLTPIPLVIAGGIFLTLLLDEQSAVLYGTWLELVVVLAVGIAATIIVRFIRKPIVTNASVPNANIEAVIARKAQGSLIYVLLGLGFVGIILYPLAFIRSGQALHLIDEHKVGERYRNTAKLARILAAVIFLLWLGVIAIIALTALAGAK